MGKLTVCRKGVLGSSKWASGLALAALLASGCTGTSTYGTGVTQEAQLYEDILGLATLAPAKKNKKIDYMARPKLVKPPTVAALPTPVEKTEGQSGYFPTDPEVQRAARKAAVGSADPSQKADFEEGELPEDVLAARRAAAERGKSELKRSQIDPNRDDHRFSAKNSPELQRRQREVFLREKAKRDGVSGAEPRRYLTEPPKEYRTPELSAEVGSVGEKEKDPYKRNNNQNFLDRLFDN